MKSPALRIQLPPDCAEKYDPVRLLGTGGFGAVILCVHRDLGRQTAVKLLHSMAGGDPGMVERLAVEARVTSSLRHPNIVQLMDIGTSARTPWVAYEYLEGETVDARIERGPIPWRDAVRIAIEIARALEAAHALQIVHRDIKPENVLCTAAGVHKVIDFGIAKWSSHSSVKTQDGLILGTPPYMCPEQIRGKPPSPRFDLYALGIMLYQMLTARLPFQSSNPHDLFHMHLKQAVPRLRELATDVPAKLERVVDTCLEKSEKRSFASAAELLQALEPLIGEEGGEEAEHTRPRARATEKVPVELSLPGKETQETRSSRGDAGASVASRGPRIAAALLAALVLTAAGGYRFAAQAPAPPPAARTAPPGDERVPEARTLHETLHRLIVALASMSDLPKEDDEWDAGSIGVLRKGCQDLGEEMSLLASQLEETSTRLDASQWLHCYQYLTGAANTFHKYRLLLKDPPAPWPHREWSNGPRRQIREKWPFLLQVLGESSLQPYGLPLQKLLSAHSMDRSPDGKRLGDTDQHKGIAEAYERASAEVLSTRDACLARALSVLLLDHARVHLQQITGRVFDSSTGIPERIRKIEDRMLAELPRLEEACPALGTVNWHSRPLLHLHGILSERVAKDQSLSAETIRQARQVNRLMREVPGNGAHDDIQKLDDLLKNKTTAP